MDILTGVGGYVLAAGVGLLFRPFMDRIIKKQLQVLTKKGIIAISAVKNEALRNDIYNFLLTLSEGMLSSDFKEKAKLYKETCKNLIGGKYDDFIIDSMWDSIINELPELIVELKKLKEAK
jgi:hypothetical protein